MVVVLLLLVTLLFIAGPAAAQNDVTQAESSSLSPSALPADPAAAYFPPSEEQKFHEFAWNALGPMAFTGSAFAAVIDQGFDFPRQWGHGEDAYSVRVASNLGIGLVTTTAQYSLAEGFHEDTKYYRCTCAGFFPRLWHAALSTVAAHHGDDGAMSFSIALTASPFIGTMTATNTWIPNRDGMILGFRLGSDNLLGQFAQNEALEFLYGGPHTLLGHIQRHFLKRSF